MSTDRDTTRIVRSWLQTDEHESADRVLDAVLDRLDETPQRRATSRPAQVDMSLTLRYGIAAAVIAVAAAVGFSLLTNVGDDRNSTAVPITRRRRNRSSPRRPAASVPRRHLTSFRASTRRTLIASSIVLDESTFRLNDSLLSSTVASDGSSLLRLTAADSVSGCEIGDVGTYRYSLSPGGSVLTIEPGTDAVRRASGCGTGQMAALRVPQPRRLLPRQHRSRNLRVPVLRARPIADVPWRARYGAFTFTVPEGWAASDDWPERYQLVPQEEYATFDRTSVCATVCPDQISLWAAPRAAAESCVEGAQAVGVGSSAADLRDWIVSHPGIVAGAPETIALGALSASVIDVEVSPSGPAPAAPRVHLSPSRCSRASYHIALSAGDRQRLILVDLDTDNALLILIDTRDPETLDTFAAEAMSIVETFEFPSR